MSTDTEKNISDLTESPDISGLSCNEDIIAAESTSKGVGAISVIRVSGKDCPSIFDGLLFPTADLKERLASFSS